MRQSRYLILAALVGLATAGGACTQKAADKTLDATTEGAASAIDETRTAGGSLVNATGDAAERAADKTKELAGDISTTAKELSATTGEVITDTWITTKVSAQFVDETLLKGSDINVDTDNHVVTLKGTVGSGAAKDRAAAIARDTDGVTSVVNQLVVT